MKKPERVKKVAKWGVLSGVFTLVVVLPFLLACLAIQAAPVRLGLAQMLAGLPIVPFWLSFVPQGKFGDLPSSFVVIGILVITDMLVTARLHHHWGRLKEENRARDLKDI